MLNTNNKKSPQLHYLVLLLCLCSACTSLQPITVEIMHPHPYLIDHHRQLVVHDKQGNRVDSIQLSAHTGTPSSISIYEIEEDYIVIEETGFWTYINKKSRKIYQHSWEWNKDLPKKYLGTLEYSSHKIGYVLVQRELKKEAIYKIKDPTNLNYPRFSKGELPIVDNAYKEVYIIPETNLSDTGNTLLIDTLFHEEGKYVVADFLGVRQHVLQQKQYILRWGLENGVEYKSKDTFLVVPSGTLQVTQHNNKDLQLSQSCGTACVDIVLLSWQQGHYKFYPSSWWVLWSDLESSLVICATPVDYGHFRFVLENYRTGAQEVLIEEVYCQQYRPVLCWKSASIEKNLLTLYYYKDEDLLSKYEVDISAIKD